MKSPHTSHFPLPFWDAVTMRDTFSTTTSLLPIKLGPCCFPSIRCLTAGPWSISLLINSPSTKLKVLAPPFAPPPPIFDIYRPFSTTSRHLSPSFNSWHWDHNCLWSQHTYMVSCFLILSVLFSFNLSTWTVGLVKLGERFSLHAFFTSATSGKTSLENSAKFHRICQILQEYCRFYYFPDFLWIL